MGCKSLLLALGACLAACGNSAESAAEKGGAKARAAGDRGALTLPVARASHASLALPDGRVLLIGGCVLESCEAGPASATVDAYNPRTGKFEPAGRLLDRRVSTALASLPSGEILLAGGWVGSIVSASSEIFAPATGRSRRGPPLSVARADIATAPLADGRIMFMGGYGGGRAVATIEIFDPRDASLRSAGELHTARAGAGAARLPDGRILIVGGGVNGANGLIPTATAEIFDPASGRSSPTGSLRQARYKHAVIGLTDGQVLVLGGSDARDRAGKLRSVERYDPAAGTFAAAGSMLEARYKIEDAVLELPDRRVLIAGGARRAEIYDPAKRQSLPVGPDFGRSLNFVTATLMGDGRVLVAGGYDENGIRMNDRAWIVRPNAD